LVKWLTFYVCVANLAESASQFLGEIGCSETFDLEDVSLSFVPEKAISNCKTVPIKVEVYIN